MASDWGILEPTEETSVRLNPTDIDIIFIPLLAVDTQGHRVGYGKGFYDRFLKQCAPQARFVGLSFFEAENKIPSDSHDIALDYCVTPKNTYTF